MKRIFYVVVGLILALIPILAITQHAKAIAPPITSSILVTSGYQSVIEPNDQFYLIEFDNTYTIYPTDYTAAQSFLVRIIDTSTNVTFDSVILVNNPYFNDGYGHGIISMYFSANDVSVNGMVYGTPTYIITLEGNPTANWTGAIPYTNSAITLTSTAGIGSRILYLASTLGNAWSTILISSGVLTDDGESYFISTIPLLRTIAPTIFSVSITPIEYPAERTFSPTYTLLLRNQWIGTWLDLTNVGTDWGINPIWIYTVIWIAVMGIIMLVTVQVSNSTKSLLNESVLLIAFGGALGFLPWLVLGIALVILIFMFVSAIFYKEAY